MAYPFQKSDSSKAPRRRLSRQERRARRKRATRRGVSVLPTMFTLGNLLCGFLAVFIASKPMDTPMLGGSTPLATAAMFIFLGMLFDGLDGRIARMTGHTSELGGQLDSMADMVTFGVAPAFIAVQLVGAGTPFITLRAENYFNRAALVIAGIYVACAALRLARFNLEVESADEKDHLSFKGLPSPGAAGTVASIVLLHQAFWTKFNTTVASTDPTPWNIRISAVVMLMVMLLVALSMVSRLRYVHLLNRYVKNRGSFGYVVKIVLLLPLLFIDPRVSLALAFIAYSLSAPLLYIWRKATGQSTDSILMPAQSAPAPPVASPSHAEPGDADSNDQQQAV